MAHILVSGNINLQTSVRIDSFPIPYRTNTFTPFGVQSQVSGVGYNVAKALAVLGHTVTLTAVIGEDAIATLIRATLATDGMDDQFVAGQVAHTPQSVGLYDSTGQRSFFTDLKDVLEQAYDPRLFQAAIQGCDLLVMTNVAYNRALLPLAKEAGVPIVTDVQAINQFDDLYNQPFMEAADILFMSGERLPQPPKQWAEAVMARFNPSLLVIGLGPHGALLAERETGRTTHIAAVTPRPVVNTGGAGDALCAAFVHGYVQGLAPVEALRQAVVFAGYKIGEAGAGGWLDAITLKALSRRTGG